jgi:hypothetical protein
VHNTGYCSTRERLSGEAGAVPGQPETVKRLEADGAQPAPLPGAGFAKVLVSEVDTRQRVAREFAVGSEQDRTRRQQGQANRMGARWFSTSA